MVDGDELARKSIVRIGVEVQLEETELVLRQAIIDEWSLHDTFLHCGGLTIPVRLQERSAVHLRALSTTDCLVGFPGALHSQSEFTSKTSPGTMKLRKMKTYRGEDDSDICGRASRQGIKAGTLAEICTPQTLS